MDFPWPDKWLNTALLGEPMSWAIVGCIASIWLILFHILMNAFGAMASPSQGAFAGSPGTVANIGGVASAFATPGTQFPGQGDVMSSFVGGATAIWTDGAEARYAEDGWIGNS